MRIEGIELKNIGVFKNEKIEFKPCPKKGKAEIHIFTGTNGSGKSTILKALAAGFESLENDGNICINDTNKIRSFFRKDRNVLCTINYQLNNNKHLIKFENCPKGLNHIHLEVYDPEQIENYRKALTLNEINDYEYSCILFSYSGNRNLIKSENKLNFENNNPLYQSLEFNKVYNNKFSIENWIKSSILKNSYAITERLVSKQKNYYDILEKLQILISDIIGHDVKFKLDEKLENPILYYHDCDLPFSSLSDGLISIISWIADLCMRLEKINWQNDLPIFERNIILFLDEIEVHLHIEWQRKILPVIQKLFPNAQIFLSTHSPFVVNSIDDAWVYNLVVENGNATVRKIELSENGYSVSTVLNSIFEVNQRFGLDNENKLSRFYELIDKAFKLEISDKENNELVKLAQNLSKESIELADIVAYNMRQIKKQRIPINDI